MEERGRERRKIERERVREMDGLNYGLRSIYTLLIGLWIEILFTVLSKLFYIWSQSLHQFQTLQEDSFTNQVYSGKCSNSTINNPKKNTFLMQNKS